MNTRTVASRFVVVLTGISLTASALAQVSPQETSPAATPAATGTYDPAQAPAAAPATQPPAYQAPATAPTYPQPAQTPAYPAAGPAAQAPYQSPTPQPPAQAPYQSPTQQMPAYPAPGAQMPMPAGQVPVPGNAYGTAPYGAMPNGVTQPFGQPPSRVRNAFAATLGAILQNAASAGTLGLSQLVTGSITAWFNRKAYRVAGQPLAPGMQATPGYAPAYPTTDPYATAQGQTTYGTQSAYPTTAQPYGTQPAYPTTAQQPYGTQPAYPTTQPGQQPTSTYPGQQTYTTQPAYPTQPNTGQPNYGTQAYNPTPTYGTTQPNGATQPYGTTAQPGTYTAATNDPYASPYGATTYYDPRTGQATQPVSYPTATGTSTPDLYAGIAYEVHAVRPAVGDAVPVNPATYEFHTGDRFLVHYRPSMPGRMEVYNVNPLGQTTLIDSVNMAAGQLSTLGPYEFAANKGDESLRLVLSPCSTPQLLVASRDIINVSNTMQPSMQSSGGVQLGSCSALTTRGVERGDKGGAVRTRDIRNVALDGGTSFALDPVSRQELTSGNLAPREVTIVFHHR